MKEPMEKFEKSRTLRLSILGLSAADFRIQNCEKWPLISEIILPLLRTCSGVLKNIFINKRR